MSSQKIIRKRNLIIFRDNAQWAKIYAKILEDYGMGMAIRTRLRRELGFSYRYHTEWIEFDRSGGRPRYYAEEQIHLDFFDEKAQSWFELKYLNL